MYRNESDHACFARDTAYSDSKDLAKRTISDKVLEDRGYWIELLNWIDYWIIGYPKYDGYQRALASMVYAFFDKKKQDQE